jgi:translation initiation factor 1
LPKAEPVRLASGKQTARVSVEKRKHGRMMTVIRGLAAANNDHPALLKKLKNACGAGGSIDEDLIELQGSHVDRVAQELQKLGYKVQ